jgi:hypothetical protein
MKGNVLTKTQSTYLSQVFYYFSKGKSVMTPYQLFTLCKLLGCYNFFFNKAKCFLKFEKVWKSLKKFEM